MSQTSKQPTVKALKFKYKKQSLTFIIKRILRQHCSEDASEEIEARRNQPAALTNEVVAQR